MNISRRILLAVLAVGVLCAVYRPVFAKDEWVQVRSKNFFLIGNASEKDIRKVATRLEQFRETFRQLFGKMNLTSPIATNVVVFKSESSYKNFKPKRADGKIDDLVAGYFQPGEDVNYITLSTEGEDSQTFRTIFHEYVHFIVNSNFGKSEIPAWFNEGLAEYYSTFAIEDDIKAKLGLPSANHVMFLRQSEFMPLGTLFGISNYQLHQTGDHSRSIFYAESWALTHYLLQKGKSEGLNTFLSLLLADSPPEKAFQQAFQIGFSQMEAELRKYVAQPQYQYNQIVFKSKLLFDADMQASALDEASSNAYLGDLLYHTNRENDAEPFLVNALKLAPDSSMANITLGMVRMKQRKFDEAKQNLEKAIAGDPKNHIAFYRYAYLLSREARDEFGLVHVFDTESAAKMRQAIRKAIALNPAFTESYELLAFVDIVNNEEFDDAVKMMQTALRYQPGNQRYALRLAEILSRQGKLDEAKTIAEKIARTSDDQDLTSRPANGLINYVAQKKRVDELNAAEKKRYEEHLAGKGSGPRLVKRIEGVKEPSEAEKIRQQQEANLRSVNESLRKTAANERRVIGHVQKIDCPRNTIFFTVNANAETFTLTSKDFQSLTLNTFDEAAAANIEVGCNANISAFNAVITYTPTSSVKSASRGEIKAIEFVAADFRIMTDEELKNATVVIYDQPRPETRTELPPPPRKAEAGDFEARRRAAMMQAIKDALPKPVAGQKQELGFLDRIECTKKGSYFYLRTPTQTLKLLDASAGSLNIVLYTPDLEGLQFDCTLKPVEFPVVFIYNDKPDEKAKSAGEIVSLGFVPKSFVLD